MRGWPSDRQRMNADDAARLATTTTALGQYWPGGRRRLAESFGDDEAHGAGKGFSVARQRLENHTTAKRQPLQ
jgi:hypothetical protein